MRLGIKTKTEFLITLNKKNKEIQNAFLEKVKKITEKHSVIVMFQDGTVKKQQTFDAQKIDGFFKNIAASLKDWELVMISSTNNDDNRRNFMKLDKIVENHQILLHFSIQYHVLLFYQPNYEVMKKQKELSDFLDTTKKQEDNLIKKSDQIILKKLKEEGYNDLDAESLFEIFYSDDKIREKIMSEIETETGRNMEEISQHKNKLLKNLDDLLLETYQIEPILIDETRLVSGEEGCVCNIDIEKIENGQKTGSFDLNDISDNVKDKIQTAINQVFVAINNAN
tara:strand:+ start:248 stop:1093 length:846 start_codon:yes stop_codon:yes gene_type:complete